MEEQHIGYGKPPVSTRFAKGRSGNPKGRPKNRHRQVPYNTILGQMVTIREDGRERRVTAAEAFLLQLTQKGLAGDSAAARASLDAIEAARASRGDDNEQIDVIIYKPVWSGADVILDTLDLARLKHPENEERARWEVSPWAVEVALKRMRPYRLTHAEQQEVWRNTRTPQKVSWPDWWTVRG